MNKNFIFNFTLKFQVLYLLIAIAGYLFIAYSSALSLITILIYICYTAMLLLGIAIGDKMQFRIKSTRSINVDKLLLGLFMVSLVTNLIVWRLMLQHYGTLAYVFSNAYIVRAETIDGGMKFGPTILTYLASLQYYGFALSMSLIHYKGGRKYFIYAILFFLLSLISDLRNFGRIGILFDIFVLISWFFLYNKKKFTLNRLVGGVVMYFGLMLPRMIRGGFQNFSSTMDRYAPSFKVAIPPIFYGLSTIYIYYFGSLVAFNEVINTDIKFQYGARNFAPFFNIINKFLPGSERVSLIADSVHIPFDHNIFHIIGELYFDFGAFGIIIIPLLFGAVIGYVFRQKYFLSDPLKLILLAWLFYTPIYNVFSFGGFLISFLFAIFIAVNFKANFNKS